MSRSVSDLVNAARAQTENLDVTAVERELAAGTEVVLVDIRETEEREQNGGIPGAAHLLRGMLEFYADPTSPYYRRELAFDKRVLLHCASGGRSALAAQTLMTMGYTNVAHLEGGFNAWKAAGRLIDY